MSQIRGTEIEGDVAVGRHVTAGGNATVRGRMTVGKDLKVEGWLEARNIRGANKGIYATAEALRESHPRPHDGWFAGVPATAEEIAYLGLEAAEGRSWFRMWTASGGEWVCEPMDKLYQITIDNRQVSELQELTERLEESVEDLRAEAAEASETAAKAKEAAEIAANEAEAARDGITAKIGQPGGIAPLDESGAIPKGCMPGGYASQSDIENAATALRDATGVLPFAGQVYSLEEALGERWKEGDVVYCASVRLFVKKTEKGWEYAAGYNKPYERGIRSDRVYRCGDRLWGVAGDGEGSAGEEGGRATLAEFLTTESIANRPESAFVTEAEYEQLEAEGQIDPETVYYIIDEDED